MTSRRTGARLWVWLGAIVACWMTMGFLPALAGGAREAEGHRIDAAWAAFAGDLSSASGIPVTYVPPMALGARGEDGASGSHGGVGVLRVGAPEGPSVIVLPEDLVYQGSVSMAFSGAGLREPRAFAQALTSTVLRLRGSSSSAGSRTLSDYLQSCAVIVPCCVRSAPVASSSAPKGFVPARNFPARWDEAATMSPGRAGPYPASHPRVRALTAWLHGTLDTVQLFVVGEGAAARLGSHQAPAGSLEAFAAEEASIPVRGLSAANLLDGVGEVLERVPALRFEDPVWTRLGSSNWALDVSLRSVGPARAEPTARRHQRTPSMIMIAAGLPTGDMQLTAVAAGESLELLPLSLDSVPLRFIQPGSQERLRFFFASTEAGQDVTAGEMGAVTLHARAAKVVDGALRTAPTQTGSR